MIVKEQALISLEPNEDQQGFEGYAAKADSGKAALVTADGDPVLGIITDGENTDGQSSVATRGYGGTVRVKLAAPAVLGDVLKLTADGRLDPAGAGADVALALEDGDTDELVEASIL